MVCGSPRRQELHRFVSSVLPKRQISKNRIPVLRKNKENGVASSLRFSQGLSLRAKRSDLILRLLVQLFHEEEADFTCGGIGVFGAVHAIGFDAIGEKFTDSIRSGLRGIRSSHESAPFGDGVVSLKNH
jgi:hypothetical protein